MCPEKIVKKESWLTTSWDDGYPLDLRIAELLSKYNLKGTFYIPFQAEREVVTPRQIRSIAKQFEIGGHTVNHNVLTKVNSTTAKTEIRESKEIIEQITGKKCSMFCFPQGKYRPEHLIMAHEEGYLGVRTVELMSIGYPSFRNYTWIVPTSVQVYPHTLQSYSKNIIKRLALKNGINYLMCLNMSWMDITEKLLHRVITDGGVFHLWGHSWEIEELSLWGKLEDTLRLLSENCNGIQPCFNSEICLNAEKPG
jgi:peptidoglycan-N-acetylglucosamine deacetylase